MDIEQIFNFSIYFPAKPESMNNFEVGDIITFVNEWTDKDEYIEDTIYHYGIVENDGFISSRLGVNGPITKESFESLVMYYQTDYIAKLSPK